MAWSTSNRHARLPPAWHRTRQRMLRDKPLCALCGMLPASEIDHIQHGDDHSANNLQAVCNDCHKTKSSSEGGRASQDARKKRKNRAMIDDVHPFESLYSKRNNITNT